jgi:hypothetical protein
MAASAKVDLDLAAAREDLAALKRDVASLIKRIKGGARARVQDAAEPIDRRARGFCHEAEAESERSAKAICAWTRKQPVLASFVGFGVGYVAARALLR